MREHGDKTPSVQVQIFNCIAARPHETIVLASKLGIVTLLFTLLVYFVGGVLIVNPFFAFFGVLACGLFWIMAIADKRWKMTDEERSESARNAVNARWAKYREAKRSKKPNA